MSTDKPLDLYWLSGSGNTLWAAQTFADRLREHGRIVRLLPIEASDPQKINPLADFGIAFPTYCFSLSEKIRSFVKGLPQVEGVTAIMLGTHGALSGGVLGPLKRMLTRKGFQCKAGQIVIMPDSFFPFTGSEINQRQISRAKISIVSYADAIVDGRARWSRWPIVSDLCNLLGYTLFSSRRLIPVMRTTVHTKRSLCSGCGTCVRQCPVGAIKPFGPGTLPVRTEQCVNCLRCVAVCPCNATRHAIGFSPYRFEPATTLSARFAQQLSSSSHDEDGEP